MFIRSLSHPITIKSDHNHKLTMLDHNSCSQIYSRCLSLQLVKTFGNETITIAKFNSRLLHSVLRVKCVFHLLCIHLCVIVCTYCQAIWQFNITLILFATNKLIRFHLLGSAEGRKEFSPKSSNFPLLKKHSIFLRK